MNRLRDAVYYVLLILAVLVGTSAVGGAAGVLMMTLGCAGVVAVAHFWTRGI